MADLSSLFQVAPWAGSYIAGDMLGQEANFNDVKQQELMQMIQSRQADAAIKQQKLPFELEKLGLENEEARVKIPGFRADSKKKELDNKESEATMDSKIAKTNASNYNDIFKQVAPQFGVIGLEIEGVPGIQQPVALAEALKRRGLNDEQAQRFVKYFSEHGGGDLPKKLGEIGDAYLRANPEYIREITQEGMRNKAHIEGIQEQGRNQIQVANIHEAGQNRRAAAKNVDAANTVARADQEAKGKPPATQALVYKKWYDAAVAAGDTEAAKLLYVKAASAIETLRNLPSSQPKPGTPDVAGLTGGQVPTNPVPTIPLNPPPGAVQPNPEAGGLLAPAGQAQSVRAAVEKAGQKYEPDKYDYRMGPNGNVQRKPKGK